MSRRGTRRWRHPAAHALAAAALCALLAAHPAAPIAAADDAGPIGAVRVGWVDAVPAGPGLDERLDEIRRRIAKALVYPPLARWRALSGETAVAFAIRDDGRATEVRTVRSSGHVILDGAAERAVRAAGVLPRVIGPLEVPIRFELRERR